MIAVISDIHSNTDALTAVLADIASRNIKRVFCLGDVVGYGPDPVACIELVSRAAEVTLMGNHDSAVMFEPANFNLAAETSCFWTRRQIEREPDKTRRDACWDFLGNLPVKYTIDGSDMGLGAITFVHASPRRPINEYIFPDDVYNNPNRVQGQFDRFSHLCFVGHTHVPGVFLDVPDFYSPDEVSGVFEVPADKKTLINVGSVGQPRDRDPRASYVILEPQAVRFIRVAYDVESAMRKVKAVPDLDDYLGSRLKEGR